MAIPFINVDAVTKTINSTRPAKVNVSQIAYVCSAGADHDPDGHAAIVFGGGAHDRPAERLVVQQTAAQVFALIDAANV